MGSVASKSESEEIDTQPMILSRNVLGGTRSFRCYCSLACCSSEGMLFWRPYFNIMFHHPLHVLIARCCPSFSRHRQIRLFIQSSPWFALWSAHQLAARVRVPHSFGKVGSNKRQYCLKSNGYPTRGLTLQQYHFICLDLPP